MSKMSFRWSVPGVCVLSFILYILAFPADAATWYVDPFAKGANNGTSWTDAWTSLAFSGISAGDTVYISGGPTGSTQTYTLAGCFDYIAGFKSGVAGNPVTYKIGQDSAHNGTAIFSRASGSQDLFDNPTYIVFSGDAGDGQMHFQTSGYSAIIESGHHYRIAYTNFGDIYGGDNWYVIKGSGVTGVEFDHNYAKMTCPTSKSFAYFAFSGSTWDDNRIHDNTIYVPRANGAGSGVGADGIETGGATGYSIYNNVIIGYGMAYTGGEHQDGWQSTGGDSYAKIYNNVLLNIGNYSLFGELYFGGLSHFRVYNNIMIINDRTLATTYAGVAFGTSSAYAGSTPPYFTDIVIANNLVDGLIPGSNTDGYGLGDDFAKGTVFASCYLVNNVMVNSGTGVDISGNSTSTVAGNKVVTAAQAPSFFSSWSANGGLANNYHLKPAATTLIGQGVNLYTYFTIDKDGTNRASAGVWDVGPYVSGISTFAPSKPSNIRLVVTQ